MWIIAEIKRLETLLFAKKFDVRSNFQNINFRQKEKDILHQNEIVNQSAGVSSLNRR